jgi:hypothetical protein
MSGQFSEGYLNNGLVDALEHWKIKPKERASRIKTMITTTIVLKALIPAVKCLFSQMISVGSEAS